MVAICTCTHTSFQHLKFSVIDYVLHAALMPYNSKQGTENIIVIALSIHNREMRKYNTVLAGIVMVLCIIQYYYPARMRKG